MGIKRMVRKVGPVHYWTESPGTGHNHSASPAAERQVSGSLLCHGALNFQQFVRWNLFESRNFSCGQGEFSQDHLGGFRRQDRSEEHTSELQSQSNLVC